MEIAKEAVYAHTLPGRPEGDWEPLDHHLAAVAEAAGSFASAFGAEEWGRLLGGWHDLGKASEEFQTYLRRSNDSADAGEEGVRPGRVDHSTFGAQHALRTLGTDKHSAWVLAYCIAGHHSGLPDGRAVDESTAQSSLAVRLKAGPPHVPVVRRRIHGGDPPSLRLPFPDAGDNPAFRVAFFIRMLFSCLIDADRSATEAFCNPAQFAERTRARPSIADLSNALDDYVMRKQAAADSTLAINHVRSLVRSACLAAASASPGFFSLNVPTGGGKTLSSLTFALHHAGHHDHRRVVIAIPFTSIVEQTADVLRAALGPLAREGLLEHHSSITPAHNTRQNQLAAENWDVPLVVTTNVQLYESLFASKPSPCRKLHRLARSVIILDEAQAIPVELLQPTLAALKELVENYGCSVVLCTATQPALQRRDGFGIGLDRVRPIVSDATNLHHRVNRVRVTRLPGQLATAEVAEHLAAETQVLCIVNTRRDASQLYDELIARSQKEQCHHLSTYMCAAHRRIALRQIRRELARKVPCRVVSTQLIEAGVDIDFAVVYRAASGFDSIAQAAGRCNREGRLDFGRLVLFDGERSPPPGLLRRTAELGRELMSIYENPLLPDAIEAYFRQLYWTQGHAWDRYGVMSQMNDDLSRPELYLQFREAARRYRVIRDDQEPLLVPFDSRARRIRAQLLRGDDVHFKLMRQLQPYAVGVWPDALRALEELSLVVAHDCGINILTSDSAYSRDKGLTFSGAAFDPELLIL